jgi:spore maturation protein CgeB
MFEATGVGTCLITDYKDNLSAFFEPDVEVVTYKSKEEKKKKTGWLLDHPLDALNIALAGQAKCLKKHNGFLRTEQLNAEILKLLSK